MRSAVRTCLQSGVAAASAPRCAASILCRSTPRSFSTSNTKSDAAPNNAKQTEADRATHFGFETVTEAEKRRRVAEVFSNVAETYDKMNDLMSFGWHRVWKYVTIT